MQVVDPGVVTAVVNTGDDAVINGLAISPDIDTVVYTLAGAIDPERGWGLGGETWNTMTALERYQATRPAGSAAATRGSASATATSPPTSIAPPASPRGRR